MTAYTGKADNRWTMRDREARAYEIDGCVCVQIGKRSAFVSAKLSEASEIIHRMYRLPAPLIWRALGVDA